MTVTPEEFLEHYGVLGMKWGVRRSREERSAARRERKSGRSQNGSDSEKKSKSSGGESSSGEKSRKEKKNPKKLSDQDLKEAVSRMQLERQYRQLSSELSPRNKGKDFVKELVIDTGKNALKQQAGNLLNKQIESAINKKLGTSRKNKVAGLDTSELAKRVRRAELEKKYNAI